MSNNENKVWVAITVATCIVCAAALFVLMSLMNWWKQ